MGCLDEELSLVARADLRRSCNESRTKCHTHYGITLVVPYKNFMVHAATGFTKLAACFSGPQVN